LLIKERVRLDKSADAEDRATLRPEVDTFQAQLRDNVAGANYAGSNLLKTTGSGNLTVMTSYNRDSSGNVTTGTIQVDYLKTRLIDSGSAKTGMLDKTFTGNSASVLSLKVSGTGAASTSTAFDNLLTGIEAALKAMSQGAAELGAAK